MQGENSQLQEHILFYVIMYMNLKTRMLSVSNQQRSLTRDFVNTKLSTQKQQQKASSPLKGNKRKFVLEPNLSGHGLRI